jgi:adenylate cyclase
MAEEGFKRKLTAILSADVEGYSRLMGKDEAATLQTLKAYREVMTSLIQQNRGRVVDSPGDNLLAEFGSVVDALDCAVKIQHELKAKNSKFPEQNRMEFRMGVNLGDVIEDEERIYGDGVNIAARVEGLADGGGICLSGTAYDQIAKKLPLGYEYLGEQTVKNIEKPIRVYRVLMDPEAAGKVIGEKRPISRHWRWAAVLLIVVAGALAIWNFYFRQPFESASVEQMAYPLPDKPSIAVLPFNNMSEDPSQEYFSDGITEEIITALSKTPKMFVIARNSTFSYKGKAVKVKQVAEELGVRYVLEGSVRKAGDQVRITAQLIDALRGHHLWAERYDRDLKDIFSLQDEITFKIITALRVKLTEGEQARLIGKGTQDLQAYLKFLQARDLCEGALSKEKSALARRLAEEAIIIDPKYSDAYTVLARTYLAEVWLGISKNPRDSLKRGLELVQKAVALKNTNAYALSMLSATYINLRQHDKSFAAIEKAYTLEPNSPDIVFRYGVNLYRLGRFEEAVRFMEETLRLNPIPPNMHLRYYGAVLRELERYDEAIVILKKAIQQEPDSMFGHLMLAVTYSLAGREHEAQEEAKEVLRINPKFSVRHLQKTLPFKNPAHAQRLINGMRKAGLPD